MNGAICQIERDQPTEDDPGVLRGVELWERKGVIVRASKVAAVITLAEGGPTRLAFDGGGHMDVCGSSEIWWRQLMISDLRQRQSNLKELTGD